MNRNFLTALRVSCVLGVVALVTGLAADPGGIAWPQFRGADRDGVSKETGLLSAWPESGPRELWRRPFGEGYSAISVVGDRIYTMVAADHAGAPTELAVALDAATGKEIWRAPIGERHDTEFGNGPRSTPTVVGDTVYVLGSRGGLAALATADGAARWKLSLTEAFGSETPHWGFSTSALIDGDLLIIEAGGPDGKSYVGLDAKTGAKRWTVGEGRPGYNSALKAEIGGKTRYVYVAGQKLTALDTSGKEVWSHPWPKGETHAMPLWLAPDRIFASGTEGIGATLFRVSESGDEPRIDEVWKNRFMRNHFSSSVVYAGHLYGFDNATLKCISVETGEMAWAKRGLGKGSLIAADGKLFVLSDRGQLLLLQATPDGYVERGSVQAIEGRSWTAPTLSAGKLFLRNHNEIVAYAVKG